MNNNDNKKNIKRNLLLPSIFLKRWMTTNTDGSNSFKYIDFLSDKIIDVDIDNDPLIKKIFEWDNSFDVNLVLNQFNQISKIARTIFDRRIDQAEENILMTNKEILFIKYFYFLISLLNGDYKYNYLNKKNYHVFDIFNPEVEQHIKKMILSIISYVLFEMYDYIFTKRIFENLYEYIENSKINFYYQEFKKQIFISQSDIESQNYKFLDLYFHNIVNNTFLKIYKVSPLDSDSLILTNKTIANFIDEKSQISILSMFIVDPRYAIGLVNLGPGRGEYRPFFKYISNNYINKGKIPSCVKPEHTIEEEGIYLNEEQRFSFKVYVLTTEQLKIINECLTIRYLKSNFDLFIYG